MKNKHSIYFQYIMQNFRIWTPFFQYKSNNNFTAH